MFSPTHGDRACDGKNSYTVVVIGGGFSGAVSVIHLLRQLPSGHSLAIVEKGDSLGHGVAYGTQCKNHLLNARAGTMSAMFTDPNHFHEYLQTHWNSEASASDFAPRYIYGEYCEDVLLQTVHEYPDRTFCRFQDEVLSITPENSHFRVILRNGPVLKAQFVILALGINPPHRGSAFSVLPGSRYIPDAWKDTLTTIPNCGNVLLVGSELTAIDQLITLRKRGFSGKVWMVSHRGLLPAVHSSESGWPDQWVRNLPRSTRLLLSNVRAQICVANGNGSSWRVVVDSLRPHLQELWKSLPVAEQRRFLRHLRPYWEIHRHRVPPEVNHLVNEWITADRLVVIAGRVVSCQDLPDGVRVTYCARESGNHETLIVDRIVNCTGPDVNISENNNPLVRSMLRQGLCRLDPHRMGLDVAHGGQLISKYGIASGALFALGPILKGCLWETTAVPEIRTQAFAIAHQVLANLNSNTLKTDGISQAA